MVQVMPLLLPGPPGGDEMREKQAKLKVQNFALQLIVSS
jgi:hypothetical protein